MNINKDTEITLKLHKVSHTINQEPIRRVIYSHIINQELMSESSKIRRVIYTTFLERENSHIIKRMQKITTCHL